MVSLESTMLWVILSADKVKNTIVIYGSLDMPSISERG